MREFQVRTETMDGEEHVEGFDTQEEAQVRYDAICTQRRKAEDDENDEEYLHDIEHIELIEVLVQDGF